MLSALLRLSRKPVTTISPSSAPAGASVTSVLGGTAGDDGGASVDCWLPGAREAFWAFVSGTACADAGRRCRDGQNGAGAGEPGSGGRKLVCAMSSPLTFDASRARLVPPRCLGRLLPPLQSEPAVRGQPDYGVNHCTSCTDRVPPQGPCLLPIDPSCGWIMPVSDLDRYRCGGLP